MWMISNDTDNLNRLLRIGMFVLNNYKSSVRLWMLTNGVLNFPVFLSLKLPYVIVWAGSSLLSTFMRDVQHLTNIQSFNTDP